MELRYNPLSSEWIIVSDIRAQRPLLPQSGCPFCPGSPELPSFDGNAFSLPNRYPLLVQDPPAPLKHGFYSTKPSQGICEVIVYSPDHEAHFPQLDLERIASIVDLWKNRYQEIGSKQFIKYVYIFENRGREIGVTLDHPHCQIHGYPLIPPKISAEMRSLKRYLNRRSRCLICDIISIERESERMLYQDLDFSWIFPFSPRWPYETHLYSNEHVQHITQVNSISLARFLKLIVSCYDKLFGFQMPYMMAIHQAPTDGNIHDYFHFHIEFYPVYRERDKLKFFAGAEMGAGMITYDYTPEKKAMELKKLVDELSEMKLV